MPSSSVYFCGRQSKGGVSAAPNWLLEAPTVVGHLAVHRRVMILGGSDRRLVFGRPVDDRQVLVLVLGYGDRPLLPQDVGQRSAEEKENRESTQVR